MKNKFQELSRAELARRAKGIGSEKLRNAQSKLYKQPDDQTNMDRYDDIRPFALNRVKLHLP